MIMSQQREEGKKTAVSDYRDIKEDYEFDGSIFCSDEEMVRQVKYIISQLPVVDRTIILLYTEYQSYRKLGQKMGLSHMTMRKEVMRIRNTILSKLNK